MSGKRGRVEVDPKGRGWRERKDVSKGKGEGGRGRHGEREKMYHMGCGGKVGGREGEI